MTPRNETLKHLLVKGSKAQAVELVERPVSKTLRRALLLINRSVCRVPMLVQEDQHYEAQMDWIAAVVRIVSVPRAANRWPMESLDQGVPPPDRSGGNVDIGVRPRESSGEAGGKIRACELPKSIHELATRASQGLAGGQQVWKDCVRVEASMAPSMSECLCGIGAGDECRRRERYPASAQLETDLAGSKINCSMSGVCSPAPGQSFRICRKSPRLT